MKHILLRMKLRCECSMHHPASGQLSRVRRQDIRFPTLLNIDFVLFVLSPSSVVSSIYDKPQITSFVDHPYCIVF